MCVRMYVYVSVLMYLCAYAPLECALLRFLCVLVCVRVWVRTRMWACVHRAACPWVARIHTQTFDRMDWAQACEAQYGRTQSQLRQANNAGNIFAIIVFLAAAVFSCVCCCTWKRVAAQHNMWTSLGRFSAPFRDRRRLCSAALHRERR